MKKTIITLFAAAALFTACDDFLNEPLKGRFDTDKVYSNPEQAQLAVNGIYNGATYFINLWKFGDVASDDAIKGGADGDQSDIEYIDNFTANADNGMLSEFWMNTYEVISRANNVIEGVSNASFDQTTKDKYIAEAKFFRALSYFNLVNIFGEVPLKLKPQTLPENIHVGLSSVEKIYEQIERDLSDAAPALRATDPGRATQGAAYGLLAKAQLYQGKYEDALTSIQLLDDLHLYDLEEDYADLFKLGNENSIESVFAICFLTGANPGLGNSLNQYFAPQNESGYYFNAPTDSYVACFNEKTEEGEDDPRLDASIGRDGKPWLNDNTFSASWSSTGYLVKKHNQPLSEVPAGTKGDGGLSYVYLRYADILLMKAEALNESHHPDLAKIEVDKVRDRAGLAETAATDEASLRTVIRNERRKELGFEFHRFFDLMRYGKEVAQAALGSDLPWTDKRFYFPIPQSEIDANQAL